MIYYRQNRVTKQLFRRVDSVPEEFMPEDRNGSAQETQSPHSTIRQTLAQYLKRLQSK